MRAVSPLDPGVHHTVFTDMMTRLSQQRRQPAQRYAIAEPFVGR